VGWDGLIYNDIEKFLNFPGFSQVKNNQQSIGRKEDFFQPSGEKNQGLVAECLSAEQKYPGRASLPAGESRPKWVWR
jgi:hypothetical protein